MSQNTGQTDDATKWRARAEAVRRDSLGRERAGGTGASSGGDPRASRGGDHGGGDQGGGAQGGGAQGGGDHGGGGDRHPGRMDDPRRDRAGASRRAQPVATLEPDDEPDGGGGFVRAVLVGIRELLIVVVLALALSFVVKTWLFQAFYIPSGSMEDTLVRDDRVIVSKLTPGPFDLRRGDVVVFEDPGTPTPWLNAVPPEERSTVGGPFHEALVFVGLLPEDAENHLIKRVIGLPGDRVQADGSTGKIRVNGVEVTESYLKPGDAPSAGRAFNIVVPQGKVWVMGDHRSDSSDSRFHDTDGTGRTGSVPMDKIVGRALFIVWPIDHVTWLGVPQRTFEQVPAPKPASKPATKPAPKPATKPATKPAPKPAPKPSAKVTTPAPAALAATTTKAG